MDRTTDYRILVIDDMVTIHDDFRKILTNSTSDTATELSDIEAEIFGTAQKSTGPSFIIDAASQGKDGLELLKKSIAENRPYALAFVDMRMPPGWDGLETIEHLWKVDPTLQVVICTAYTDYSWDEIEERLGGSDRLLILKKPFDNAEIRQMACTLTHKWSLQRAMSEHIGDLDRLVAERTQSLEETNEMLKTEMLERSKIEQELRLAQKLESVGQLAAGIAHEINTPMQFIGDNVMFLQEAFEDLIKVIDALYPGCYDLARQSGDNLIDDDVLKKVETSLEEADLEYVRKRVPKALERTLAGIERVSRIVSAMKRFSHPGGDEVPINIKETIENVLTVSSNEYKYVADIDVDIEEVPDIVVGNGELNQVLLNLVVNAAHAIESSGQGKKGRISIRSWCDEQSVTITVEDTGCGIPESVQARIFDPFFTTKAVGKGTGQGLSLARTIIVERCGGDLSFETEEGVGTTFYIKLPVQPKNSQSMADEDRVMAEAA